MTLNFQKHGAAIQAAYDRVAESKTNDEWFILDYEGNSNVIKIGEEGDYGLDEFCTSFNSGRLQYGVIGIRMAKTALTKIVLVHWQGEGVPSSRVASTTSHIDDVRRYLKSVHVVHYARSEIDVEPEVIKREVAKLPATHANADADTYYSAPTPVGSVYKPTKPHMDINMKQRDEFWEKLNKEEASSKKSEELARVEEKKRRESVEREEREAQRRAEEKRQKEEEEKRAAELRKKNVSQLHHTPSPSAPLVSALKFNHAEKSHTNSTSPPTSAVKSNSLEKPHKTVVTGPHKLKLDRLGMFERKDEQLPSPTRITVSHNFPAKKTEPFHPSPSPVLSSSGTVSPSRDSVTSNGISSFYSPSDSGYEAGVDEGPHSGTETLTSSGSRASSSKPKFNLHQNNHYEEPPVEEHQHATHSSSVTKSVSPPSSCYEEPPFDAPPSTAQPSSTPGNTSKYDVPPGDVTDGLRAIALWDYQAADSTEISFDPDDYITEIDQIDPGWWRGRGPHGDVGLFPANYVKLL